MAINLSKLQYFKPMQNNLMSSASFLGKNKITVNQPVQSHFSVQGVQAYSPEQIKAIKAREEKAADKEGVFAKVQVYEIADFPEDEKESDQIDCKAVKKANKGKQKPKQSAKKQFKTNARNSMSVANQNLVKNLKINGQKTALERKLEKLSKKYKEHFKGIDMKEGIKGSQSLISQDKNQSNDQKLSNDKSKVNQSQNEFEIEQDTGQQCVPSQQVPKSKKNIKIKQKSNQKSQKLSNDSSF